MVERAAWTVWADVEVNALPAHLLARDLRGRRPPVDPARRRGESPSRRTSSSTCSTALVLAGGADIDPATYGAEPRSADSGLSRRARPLRARARPRGARSRAAACSASAAGCRSSTSPAAARSTSTSPTPSSTCTPRASFSDHEVRLEPRLAGRPRRRCRADHRCAPTTTRASAASATASSPAACAEPGGAVEAIEMPGRRWALGILWHTEEERRSPVLAALTEARARTGGGGVIQVVEPSTSPGDGRGSSRRRRGDRRRGRRCEGRLPGLARGRAGRPGAADAAPLGGDLRRISRSSRCSRRATRASRSAMPATRSGWSPSASATTPERRSACSAKRSRWRAEST